MKMKSYLAGSMEYAENLGAGWRDSITEYLKQYDIDVLNPCAFEPQQLKGLHPERLPEKITNRFTGEEFTPKHWHELKLSANKENFKRFLKYMRRIIKYDIKILTTQADIVICYWDPNTAKGAGTHSELSYAFMNNIPVYCVNVCEMPAWALGCCTKNFTSFEDLYEFLDEEFGGDTP